MVPDESCGSGDTRCSQLFKATCVMCGDVACIHFQRSVLVVTVLVKSYLHYIMYLPSLCDVLIFATCCAVTVHNILSVEE